MPPTRGHLKLAMYFVAVATLGAWWASRWLAALTEERGAGLVDAGEAGRAAVTVVLATAGAGFLGVLVRRMTVARARARELAMWAEKVQAESKKYRALFEGSADMLLIVDPRTRAFREGNAAARASLGGVAAVEDLLGEGPRARLIESLQRVGASAGADQTLADVELRAQDGRTLIADARLSPIEIAGERLVLLSLRDETRQRAMERELAMRERLSSIGLFTAGVAHEINNPLEGIGNYLTLLEREELPPESRRRYLALVQHGFGRIRDLVRDLLHFARPERGDARVDLSQVVERASALVALSASMKSVVVEKHGVERALELAGDAGRLEQVLVNLLLNAGKAQEGRGRVHVRARALAAEPAIELVVEDEGPGIPPENLTRIFDPFFGSGSGSGLGLSVSYGIVRAHGGSLTAENRPEGGARFTIRLPRNLPEAHA